MRIALQNFCFANSSNLAFIDPTPTEELGGRRRSTTTTTTTTTSLSDDELLATSIRSNTSSPTPKAKGSREQGHKAQNTKGGVSESS